MAFLRSYHHKHTLRVNGNVVILACSQIGRFLAAGGSEGTHVFDLQAVKKLDSPRRAGSRGSTTSLCFGRQLGSEVLYSGTSDGFVFVWRLRNDVWEERHSLQITYPAEIRDIALDAAQSTFVVCTRSGRVLSYILSQHPVNGTWISTVTFSKQLDGLSPNRVLLTPSAVANNPIHEISLFGFHDNGHVFTLSGATGELIGKWPAGGQVSDIAVNTRDGMLCLDDPHNGPVLMDMASKATLRTLKVPGERKSSKLPLRPKKVAFGEDGSILVTGSDKGVVFVYDTAGSDQPIQKLQLGLGDEGRTQVVAVATGCFEGTHMVFAARARFDGSPSGDEEIVVWKRQSWKFSMESFFNMETFVQYLCIACCFAWVYNTYGDRVQAAVARLMPAEELSVGQMKMREFDAYSRVLDQIYEVETRDAIDEL